MRAGPLAASQRIHVRAGRHLGHLQNEKEKTTKFKFVSPHILNSRVRHPGCSRALELADISAICKMKIKHENSQIRPTS